MNIFGYRQGQPVQWFFKRPERSNHYCPYCGAFVGSGSQILSDKEHLIARNFVPVGTLANDSFNFIFRACRKCNCRKAHAERHISSVTLFNSPARSTDQVVDKVAQHKASRDYHPHGKGLLVQDAFQDHEVEFNNSSFRLNFNLITPPQVDPLEVELLARNQVQALFALITTKNPRDPSQTSLLPADRCRQFGYFGYGDWGNPQLVEIIRRAAGWPCRTRITAASGYFKAILRRSPESAEGWFWALEWNRFLRVVGAIALPTAEPALFQGLPELGWTSLPDSTGRYREEVLLSENEDVLFSWDDEEPLGTPPTDSH